MKERPHVWLGGVLATIGVLNLLGGLEMASDLSMGGVILGLYFMYMGAQGLLVWNSLANLADGEDEEVRHAEKNLRYSTGAWKKWFIATIVTKDSSLADIRRNIVLNIGTQIGTILAQGLFRLLI